MGELWICQNFLKKILELLEYIEPICIKAHLEAHVLDLYIPTHLGLEEETNYPVIMVSVD